MTPEAYVTACGGCCPVCRSGQTAGESFDTEAAQVWQRVRCLDCEAMWTDVYSLQGYEDLERPVQVPEEEHARLLREMLLDRNLNPYDVLDLAAGVEAALLALPAIQAHIQAAWHEERQRAAEEAEEREEISTDKEVRMAERMCPVCTKRPVWRTNQSNNWRHVCKRCYHKAWAADQKAQRAARRATTQRR
jgi:hypothetical protein